MTTLSRSSRRWRPTTRSKQLLPCTVFFILVVALASIQDYHPTKLLGEAGFPSFAVQTTKQKSTSSTKERSDGQTPSSPTTTTQQHPISDPSSIPFDKDYLPPRLKEKWRNRHSTGARLGAHKLKRVAKEIFSEIEQEEADGRDQPSATTQTIHYHAIVVPYRNREYHLQEFQKRLYPYIEQNFRASKQQHVSEFSLWIIEQADQEPFNRGWLGNVGIAEIVRHTPEVECLTFHDVDFVPETMQESDQVKGPVHYDKCSVPTQSGSELYRTGLNWTVGYKEHAGGVVTMHLQHWQAINGFSNDYIGWGAEDDDLYLRLRNKELLSVNRQRKFLMRRPPTGFGRFRTVSDAKEHHVQDSDKGKNPNYQVSLQILEQVRDGLARVDRSDYDGLNDLQYKVNSHKVRETSSTFGFEMAHYLKVKQQLLEYISIPGTEMEWLETAANRLGIPWGRCHFELDDEDRFDYAIDSTAKRQGLTSQCLEADPDFANLGLRWKDGRTTKQVKLWHVPTHLWNIDMFLGKHTFAVVRNPYDLVIARYLEQNATANVNLDDDSLTEEQKLNEFVERKLCDMTNMESIWGFSQYDYTFVNGTQRVKHVLKHENLSWELPRLMQQYDLPLELLGLEKPANGEGAASLTIKSLTNRSVALIQRNYARDFAEFGYSQLLKDAEQGNGLCSSPTQT